jgi:signal transduction histidine kinase
VIAGTLRVAPLHIWAVSALTLPFSLIGQFTRYGFVQSIVMQSVWLLLVLLIQLTVERTIKATNGNYLPQNLSLIGGIAFVVSPALLVLQMNWPQNSYTLTNSLITHTSSMISIISFMCASSLVLALHEDRSQVFKALGDALKEKDLQLLVRSGRQAHSDADYAQYLHAEVQSQLLACKLLLLKAAESEFTLFEPEVTKQIIDRFEKIKQPYERPAARIPSKRVDELEKSWAGIAEISSELSPELGTLHSYSDVLSQLIEESVVNSIRHGKAQEIHIRSFPTPGLINVVITDNGQLKEGNTGSGLGTILFDTFAKSWTIGREGDETVVKFSIATDA